MRSRDPALPLDEERLSWLLLDVEGTTTPIEFVHRILFPYSREHAGSFLREHSEDGEVQEQICRLRAEHSLDVKRGSTPPNWLDDPSEDRIDSATRYVHWLMDRDRKSTPLKALQGRIWEEGYRSGELHGDVYSDVPAALFRWRKQNRKVAIFSSGSVLAQKLLFGTIPGRDLSAFLGAHFDTGTGSKIDAESYRRIAMTLRVEPPQMAFISDVVAELDAAAHCGVQTLLCVRSGQLNRAGTGHRVIHSFDEVLP
ncbi:MAG TPA: acireductone synthase [Terriglobia bacterium]|nr:acireductone synthase [Terriglobia bacterium]